MALSRPFRYNYVIYFLLHSGHVGWRDAIGKIHRSQLQDFMSRNKNENKDVYDCGRE